MLVADGEVEAAAFGAAAPVNCLITGLRDCLVWLDFATTCELVASLWQPYFVVAWEKERVKKQPADSVWVRARNHRIILFPVVFALGQDSTYTFSEAPTSKNVFFVLWQTERLSKSTVTSFALSSQEDDAVLTQPYTQKEFVEPELLCLEEQANNRKDQSSNALAVACLSLRNYMDEEKDWGTEELFGKKL
ncbi:hypothetical protein Pelo_14752 [Pelomyxa schiedti]|nr:hypothetical protein Pelo_14752 [Pelomyxa schiedti]